MDLDGHEPEEWLSFKLSFSDQCGQDAVAQVVRSFAGWVAKVTEHDGTEHEVIVYKVDVREIASADPVDVGRTIVVAGIDCIDAEGPAVEYPKQERRFIPLVRISGILLY